MKNATRLPETVAATGGRRTDGDREILAWSAATNVATAVSDATSVATVATADGTVVASGATTTKKFRPDATLHPAGTLIASPAKGRGRRVSPPPFASSYLTMTFFPLMM